MSLIACGSRMCRAGVSQSLCASCGKAPQYMHHWRNACGRAGRRRWRGARSAPLWSEQTYAAIGKGGERRRRPLRAAPRRDRRRHS
eukprot:gene19075-biopygen41765